MFYNNGNLEYFSNYIFQFLSIILLIVAIYTNQASAGWLKDAFNAAAKDIKIAGEFVKEKSQEAYDDAKEFFTNVQTKAKHDIPIFIEKSELQANKTLHAISEFAAKVKNSVTSSKQYAALKKFETKAAKSIKSAVAKAKAAAKNFAADVKSGKVRQNIKDDLMAAKNKMQEVFSNVKNSTTAMVSKLFN